MGGNQRCGDALMHTKCFDGAVHIGYVRLWCSCSVRENARSKASAVAGLVCGECGDAIHQPCVRVSADNAIPSVVVVVVESNESPIDMGFIRVFLVFSWGTR